MKRTIKERTLEFIMQHPNGVSRKEVQLFVMSINGTTRKSTQGYYSDSFLLWTQSGLIESIDKKLYITELGKVLVESPQAYKIVAKHFSKKMNSYNDRIQEVAIERTDYRHLSEELIDILQSMNNKYQLLFCDMIWQEELFEMQEMVVNRLYKLYERGQIKDHQLLRFEYVFSTSKTA